MANLRRRGVDGEAYSLAVCDVPKVAPQRGRFAPRDRAWVNPNFIPLALMVPTKRFHVKHCAIGADEDIRTMDRFARTIAFASAQFPRHSRDAELANGETMHGYALARHIGEGLAARGTTVSAYVPEDWGWYCEIRLPETAIAYGVVAEDGGEDFLIQFIPDKPFVRKLFRKIDIAAPLAQLQDDVFAVLQAAPSSSPPEWSEG